MFDDFSNADDGGGSSGISDILSALTDTATAAYSSYQLSSAGIIPVAGQPGTFVQTSPSGGAPRIVTPQATQNNTTAIVLGFLALIGIFAFKNISSK